MRTRWWAPFTHGVPLVASSSSFAAPGVLKKKKKDWASCKGAYGIQNCLSFNTSISSSTYIHTHAHTNTHRHTISSTLSRSFSLSFSFDFLSVLGLSALRREEGTKGEFGAERARLLVMLLPLPIAGPPVTACPGASITNGWSSSCTPPSVAASDEYRRVPRSLSILRWQWWRRCNEDGVTFFAGKFGDLGWM